eukprot:COSAG04_NODE_815_length_10088_cov_12.515667_12_plen_172_part_00
MKETAAKVRRLLSCVPMMIVTPTALFSMVKWGSVDLLLTEWLISDFALSIGTASLVFSTSAGTYMLFSPVGGWLADRVSNKKTIIAAGLITQGILGVCAMRWVSSVPQLVLWLAVEGMISPACTAGCLPDMLDHAPGGKAADGTPDEHITNLTTCEPSVPVPPDAHDFPRR